VKARVSVVACLLFGSGTCALIYQVTWLRMMRLVFGASTAASAAVLAIFMGGLGVGGVLLGRRVDRHPRPLAFYAQLEFFIAISSAATPALVWLVRQVYTALGGSIALGMVGATIVRLLLATLVLLVPTVLMGGTLPAAARAVETAEDVGRRNLAVLYGLNTLGAVTGALLSTFFMMEHWGARLTLWSACGVNLLVALAARLIAQSLPAQSIADEPVVPAAPTPAAAPAKRREQRQARRAAAHPTPGLVQSSGRPVPAWFVLIAAAVVGFAFLLMELVWYRMLAPVLGGSSYTFGLILAAALLGIGLGGGWYALSRSDRPATLSAFALTCTLEAAFIAIPYALGDRIAFLSLGLRTLENFGFSGLAFGWAQVAILVVLPAAFVSGVQFPLLIALLGRGGDKIGRHVGLAYAWNTVGAIVGSLAGGFGLITALSAPGAWRAVVVVLVVLGLSALIVSVIVEGRWLRVLPSVAVAVGALMLLPAVGPTAVWRHSAIGAGRAELKTDVNSRRDWANRRRRAIRWEADGVESSVAIDGTSSIAFVVNGKSDGSATGDAPTQVMGGMIGAILHPKPTRALVVGLGTGSTAGWLGTIGTMERVDVVELEPAIREIARRCAPVNRDVLNNPKVHVFIGDAREVLLTTPERYDVIFSEPSNPYRAGVASLFTREFYQETAARLAESGVFLQWVQTYEVDGQTIRTIIATLRSVFPVVEMYETQKGDLVLVSALKPIDYDVPRLRARVEEEPYRSALSVGFGGSGLEGFLARFVASTDVAQAIAEQEGSRLNTDDQMLVEYGFARSVGHHGLFDSNELWNLSRARHAERPALKNGEVDWVRVDDQRVGEYVANQETVPVLPPNLTAEQLQRAQALTEYADGNLAAALAAWQKQPREPETKIELAMKAEAVADTGDEAALKYIEKLRPLQATTAEAIMARFLWRKERNVEATEALEAAFKHARSDPWANEHVMSNAMAVAENLAVADSDLALRLYRALSIPFAVLLVDELRIVTAIAMTQRVTDRKLCAESLAPFEPDPSWDHVLLEGRLKCYQDTDSPLVHQAQMDLDAFDREVPKGFAQGLDNAS
jgi:spermidine synthase